MRFWLIMTKVEMRKHLYIDQGPPAEQDRVGVDEDHGPGEASNRCCRAVLEGRRAGLLAPSQQKKGFNEHRSHMQPGLRCAAIRLG